MGPTHTDPTVPADATREPRRHGRCKCDDHLICRQGKRHFGTVMDLSASGMRVFRKGGFPLEAGSYTVLTMAWFDFELAVKVKVAWTRQVGFRKHMAGLEFAEHGDSFKAAITRLHRLARNALSHSRAVYDSAQ